MFLLVTSPASFSLPYVNLGKGKNKSREWEEGGGNRRKVYVSLVAATGNRTEIGLIWGEWLQLQNNLQMFDN